MASNRLSISGEYPPDWPAIGDRVRAKSGHRCIRCKHPYRTGAHGKGEWTPCDDQCTHLFAENRFRKPGENPRPVFKRPETFPVEMWQEYASPVWMTVDQGRVLNGEGAREQQDERHICPLQLDVIERAVTLWSNPGDLVFSPFAGIGSEGHASLRLGRKFVGSELKRSYFDLATSNLNGATAQKELVLA